MLLLKFIFIFFFGLKDFIQIKTKKMTPKNSKQILYAILYVLSIIFAVAIYDYLIKVDQKRDLEKKECI